MQLIVLCTILCLLQACKKDSATFDDLLITETKDDTSQKIDKEREDEFDTFPIVNEDWLVFECEEKMAEFIHYLSDKEIDVRNIDKTYGYQSYLNNVTPTDVNEIIFDNERFAAILNKDGVVEIGGYIFKLNPATEQTFAIKNIVSKEEIDNLIFATDDKDIPTKGIVFSFDDDAFSELDWEASCKSWWGCGEDCAARKKDTRSNNNYCQASDNVGAFSLLVKYQAVTIFRWANVQFTHECIPNFFGNGACNNKGFSDIRYFGEYKRKCRDGITKDKRNYVCDFVPDGFNAECFPINTPLGSTFKHTFYEDTRCLSEYLFQADARLRDVCEASEIKWTGFVKIQAD